MALGANVVRIFEEFRVQFVNSGGLPADYNALFNYINSNSTLSNRFNDAFMRKAMAFPET